MDGAPGVEQHVERREEPGYRRSAHRAHRPPSAPTTGLWSRSPAPGTTRAPSFPIGISQPGATRPMGVTKEHLLGPKTAGFRGVAPGFLPGALSRHQGRGQMHGQVRRIKGLQGTASTTPSVIGAVIRSRGCDHTLARRIGARRRARTAPRCGWLATRGAVFSGAAGCPIRAVHSGRPPSHPSTAAAARTGQNGRTPLRPCSGPRGPAPPR